jgi:hypothetical protein
MAFPESVIDRAWTRAGGRCECKRKTCGHIDRCPNVLVFTLRGHEDAGGWEAHHKTASILYPEDTLGNCEILCVSCHKNTRSYGG